MLFQIDQLSVTVDTFELCQYAEFNAPQSSGLRLSVRGVSWLMNYKIGGKRERDTYWTYEVTGKDFQPIIKFVNL